MSKAIQWNLRGYRSRYLDLQNLLQDLQPVCVSLQETMLGDHIPNSPRNYLIETFSPTPHPVPGNGLAILIRKDSGYTKLALNTTLQAMAVQLNFHPKLMTICNLYVSPGDILNLNDLRDLINQLPRPFVLGGDFNAKSAMWGNDISDQRGQTVEDLIGRNNICILNTHEHTHFHLQTGTSSAIDLTLASPDVAPDLQWSVLNDLYGSDHYPIMLQSMTSRPTPSEPHLILRRADWHTFESLTQMDDVNEDLPVDELTELLTSRMKTAASIAIPRSRGGTVTHNVPWWNDSCELAKIERKRALRRYQRTRLMIDKIAYNRARAKAQQVKRIAQETSWRKYASSINSDTPMNRVWQRINKMRNRHRDRMPCLRTGGNTVADPEDVANLLADNFEDISSGLHYPVRFLPIRTRTEQRNIDFDTRELCSYNEEITMLELYSALKQAKNSSAGPDGIAYLLLKRLHPSALGKLLALFNKIWSGHRFPNSWREATVLAFPKPDKDPTAPSNYRPIALTSCMGKLLERVVNVRLVKYLESQSKICSHQYGFRPCRGTCDALTRVHNFLKVNVNEGKHAICVFFDIKKAYDTAWRAGILKAVHEAGVRGNLGHYIKEFLRERRFRVKVGNAYSTKRVQREGVPQGSVISCTLFLLALNGITTDLPADVHASLYVDDLMLYASSRYLPVLGRRLQRSINSIEQWAAEHGFVFSAQKTTAVLFNLKRRRTPPPNLAIATQPIPFSTEAKFLGMIFDNRLNWQPHIKHLKTICTRKLNLLKCLSRISWGADRQTLLHIYRSLIRAKLDYGCSIYQAASKTVLSTLDPVHNAALRLCTGAFRSSPVDSLYVDSGEPPLHIRRAQLTLQYLTRLNQLPESPTWHSVRGDEIEARDPQYFIPASVNYEDIIRTTNLNIHHVTPVSISDTPTWQILISTFCNKACYPKKQETPSAILKGIFRDHINAEHQDSVHIYTDGSKDGGSVGCAATCIYGTTQKRLHPNTSIFSAELYAIVEALNMVEQLPHINFTIFSDSQAAVSASRHYNSHHPIVSTIVTKLTLLQLTYKTIQICWLPSHVDIKGNDEADEAAKRASQSDDPPYNETVPCRDLYPAIKGAIMGLWQRNWDTIHDNKLRTIKETTKQWTSSCCRERRLEVTLARLRIGHTRLTHAHLMERRPPPLCDHCDVALTVLHVIAECPRHNDARRAIYPSSQATNIPLERLRLILAETNQRNFDPQRVKYFLLRCGLYDKI